MSRHKLVKQLDLEDELNDFDGGDQDDFDDADAPETTEEEKEHMRNCTAMVRQALGDEFSRVSDKEIEESLWYYYYDIDKTVQWLRKQHLVAKLRQAKPGASKHPAPASRTGGTVDKHAPSFTRKSIPSQATSAYREPCPRPQPSRWISAAGFFDDTPWLRVPLHRQGNIREMPCHPRGGLLGGSAAPGKGKMSKLQALAAARQKKEAERVTQSSEGSEHSEAQTDKPMRILEKLSHRKGPSQVAVEHAMPLSGHRDTGPEQGPTLHSGRSVSAVESGKDIPDISAGLRTGPSAFANTILGQFGDGDSPGPGLPLQKSHMFSYLVPWNTAENAAFLGPSPDDIVTAAQTPKGKPAESGTRVPTAPIENGIKAISIDPTPQPKRKNIDVVAEYNKSKRKPSANFVVIGHVDHGKSTLLGRLLLDVRVVDSRTVEKYRKEAEKIGKSSFALAWVLDQTSEERSRGITMDVATNRFETDKASFTILDAPGHRDFIPNMIAGASQADFAVLVIDATPNAFESGLKGQTREHALLVRSMGVQRLIVAVNKMDLSGWAQERFEEIRQQVLVFLTAAGFQSKAISFLPCSGLSGDNVARRVTEGRASWYTGPTLIELLEDSSPAAQALDVPFRMTIGDIFRGGVVHPLSISGRIEAGHVQVGDSIVAMPSGEKASIKDVEIDHQPAEWAVAGQIVVLHLTDIDAIHLKVGDVLCSPKDPVQIVSALSSKMLVFDHLTPMAVDIHRGHLHAPGRITQLIAVLDKASGAVTKKKPKIIKPGSVARIKVELDQGVPLEPPARIILRSNGETVAAGIIENTTPKAAS